MEMNKENVKSKILKTMESYKSLVMRAVAYLRFLLCQ